VRGGGSGFVSRGLGAGGTGTARTGTRSPGGGVGMRQAGGRRALAGLSQGSGGSADYWKGGFVWVVISGPSWEPLMIRKSNKQGNPVFHTQPWPRPERLCVSSSSPHEAAVSYQGIGREIFFFSPHLPQSANSVLLVQLAKAAHHPGKQFCRQRSTVEGPMERLEWCLCLP
jgi:hypothetical protein